MKRTVLFVLGCVLCSTPVLAGDGAAIYQKRCKTCHSVAGSGGPMAKMGGPLDGIGSKRDKVWLAEFLKNPKSKEPDSKMPALRLTDEERDAVIEYLLSLK